MEMDRARVFIVPLRWGAGFKGKIATAMAAGIPSVMTRIAAEGMGLTDGIEGLIADDWDAFLDHAVRLYCDEMLWHEVAHNGMMFANERWSPSLGKTTLRHILMRARVPPTFALSDEILEIARRTHRKSVA